MTDIAKSYGRYMAGLRICARLWPIPFKYAAASAWTRTMSPRLGERELVKSQMGRCVAALPIGVEAAWLDYLWHAAANTLNTYLYSSMRSEWIGSSIEVRGEEHLRAAYEKGAGVLMLTAHQHSLMMLAVSIGLLRFPTHAILMNPKLTVPSFLEEYAERAVRDSSAHYNGGGYLFVDYGSAFVRPVYRALQAGCVVVSANDFPADLAPKRRQLIPFLGQKISCPTGSVEVAIQTSSAIVPGFIRRENGHFIVEFHPEICGDTKNIMSVYGSLLEATVRADPGGWEGWKWPNVFDVFEGELQ